MELTEPVVVDVRTLVGDDDIECECMLCHLPFGEPHPPIEWRYTVRFPGPYPKPGMSIMLLCARAGGTGKRTKGR